MREMNEVGKTFRKLICNYENAHTSSEGIDLTLPSFYFPLNSTGKGVACDLKITVLFHQNHMKGKTFSEISFRFW